MTVHSHAPNDYDKIYYFKKNHITPDKMLFFITSINDS